MTNIDYKDYVAEKLEELNRQYLGLDRKLDAILNNTMENNTKLVELQTRYNQIEKDVNSLGNNNRIQHLEFYSNFAEIRKEIDKADLKEMKDDVKRHDSKIDKFDGAIKILYATIVIISIIFGILSYFK